MLDTRNARATALSTLAIVALGLPLACLAAAPPAPDPITVKISYSDLDIRSQDGATELYSRLKRASRQACQHRSTRRLMTLREIAEARQCYRESLDAAVQRIGSKALHRVHAG